MINDPVLLNDWHPVASLKLFDEKNILAVRLLDEELVLWRVGKQVLAWQDLCIHRGTRLSLGKIEAGSIVCPYHGWVYDETGQCIKIPAHPDQLPPNFSRWICRPNCISAAIALQLLIANGSMNWAYLLARPKPLLYIVI